MYTQFDTMTLRLFSNHYSPFDSVFDWQVADPFGDAVTYTSRAQPKQAQSASLLNSDLMETEHDYRILTDLPGVENLEVSIDKDVMTVQAERSYEKKHDTDRYHSLERSYGKMQRKFKIPQNADADKAEARLEQGVLTITLPKKAPAPAPKRRQLLSIQREKPGTNQHSPVEGTTAESAASAVMVEDVNDEQDEM